MNRLALNAMFAASFLAGLMMIGCDKTVSEETTIQKKSDDTTVTKTEKTTQSPDGGVKTTSERKVDPKPEVTTVTEKTTVSPDGSSKTTTEHKVGN